jgi:drug/metabolite transporter (DMT)-like permease
MNSRVAPGPAAFALMVLLCAIWGLQQVAMKFASAEISPILQAGLRSGLGAVLVYVWARWRGVALFAPDRSLWPGLLAGVLFGLEFVFIFVGVERTTVSRMVVFLYTAPCFTVLGLHFFVPGERMGWRQGAGVLLAFAGLIFAFIDKSAGGSFLGDAFGVLAALFWPGSRRPRCCCINWWCRLSSCFRSPGWSASAVSACCQHRLSGPWPTRSSSSPSSAIWRGSGC